MRVTPSKDWDALHADPLKSGHRWFCACRARYRAKWGQLVQVSRALPSGDIEHVYARAEVPPWCVEDVRAMHLEETVQPTSAEDLFSKVKRCVPTLTELVVATPDGGRRVVDIAAFEALPVFPWHQIFNMAGAEAPASCSKGK